MVKFKVIHQVSAPDWEQRYIVYRFGLVCVCKVLFPIRYAAKQQAREQITGEKTEKPYIYKPSTPSASGPSSSDSKTGIGVC